MARKLTDETLRMDIVLNGNKAQAQLGKLQKQQHDLRRANEDLREAKQKLIAQGKKESAAYKEITAQIKANNQSLTQNKNAQADLRKQIGITSLTTRQLTQEQKRLKALMSSISPGTDKWEEYNKELGKVTARQREIRDKIKETSNSLGAQNKSLVSSAKNWLSMAVGIGAAIEIARRVITFAKDFVTEGLKMADQARGVEFAFKAIGKTAQQAFLDVRKAVRGTLSDLDIRKALVNFYNFKIPQESAATFFEFLTLRSTQTGEDITKLQSSLVEGLSKQSKLRIDNLGISMLDLNDELEKTPDFIQAVANIAQREVAKAGSIIDEAASGTARWNASTDNLQLALGKLVGTTTKGTSVVSVFSDLIDGFTTGVDILRTSFSFLTTGISNFLKPILSTNDAVTESESKFKSFWKTLGSGTLTVLSVSLMNIGKILSGIGSVIELTQKRFASLLTSLAAFTDIEIDFLNPSKTFESLKSFDFEKAFSDVKGSFSAGGKSMGEAFKEGFNQVTQQVIDEANSENANPQLNPNINPEPTPEELAEQQAALQREQQRLDQLKALEEQYLKEKEERLATSNEAMARLQLERALQEANILKASNDTLDLIRAEHKIKINEAIIEDQNLELERLKSFENIKRDLHNQIDIENAESKEARDLLLQEQQNQKEQERLELELERLNLSESEKTELLAHLTEIQEGTIEGIRSKWRKIKENEEQKEYAKKQRLYRQGLDAAIQIAGAETKVGKGLLIAKQLLAVKEAAIALGLFQTKATLAQAGAGVDIAAGTAKSASAAPFPANLPLIIGFVSSVAGLISTISKLGKTKVKTQGFEDGLYPDKNGRVDVTRTDGKRFNAQYGGATRTGVVSQPTLFRDKLVAEAGPELIVDNKTLRRVNPSVLQHIYDVRDNRVRGYETGNFPTLPTPTDTDAPQTQEQLLAMTSMMMDTLTTLNMQLAQGIRATALIGYQEAEDIEDLNKERDTSSTNGTLNS